MRIAEAPSSPRSTVLSAVSRKLKSQCPDNDGKVSAFGGAVKSVFVFVLASSAVEVWTGCPFSGGEEGEEATASSIVAIYIGGYVDAGKGDRTDRSYVVYKVLLRYRDRQTKRKRREVGKSQTAVRDGK